MGCYELIIYRPARRYLERCDKSVQRRLAARLDALTRNPYSHGKPLAGAERYWSTRVGSLRMIYEIDEAHKTVHVYSIGPRGQIYRELKKI